MIITKKDNRTLVSRLNALCEPSNGGYVATLGGIDYVQRPGQPWETRYELNAADAHEVAIMMWAYERARIMHVWLDEAGILQNDCDDSWPKGWTDAHGRASGYYFCREGGDSLNAWAWTCGGDTLAECCQTIYDELSDVQCEMCGERHAGPACR